MTRCDVCGHKTLPDDSLYEICPVCYWEADPTYLKDEDKAWGGPNHSLSLNQARQNYRAFGAVEQRFIDKVRPPTVSESAE